MIQASQIKPHAPVVCSNDGPFATVDHREGRDTVKLEKDAKGQHHFIPLSGYSLGSEAPTEGGSMGNVPQLADVRRQHPVGFRSFTSFR